MPTYSNLLQQSSILGQAVSTQNRAKWKHPWTITPAWVPSDNSWIATVKAGFVNENAAVVRTTIEQQGRFDRHFGINPLTGLPYFSAHVFKSLEENSSKAETIDIPLYLSPVIPLLWRSLGWDGNPQFPVPQFFITRGAAPAPKIDQEALADGLGSANTPSPPSPGRRLLRACDLWIRQPRQALTSQISLEPGPLTGISNVTQSLGVRLPPSEETVRVIAGYFSPPRPGLDPLGGIYEEPNWDELLIGTIFLLSPPDAPEGSLPDGTWAPFVRHNLFWNLQYVPKRFQAFTTDSGTPYIPPLAAGAAQLINFLTASLNDLTQQALNILTAHSMAGTFYTLTGGGHSAQFPIPAETESTGDQVGLDKAARLTNARLRLARQQRAERLDPLFPYRAEPFDPVLFTA